MKTTPHSSTTVRYLLTRAPHVGSRIWQLTVDGEALHFEPPTDEVEIRDVLRCASDHIASLTGERPRTWIRAIDIDLGDGYCSF